MIWPADEVSKHQQVLASMPADDPRWMNYDREVRLITPLGNLMETRISGFIWASKLLGNVRAANWDEVSHYDKCQMFMVAGAIQGMAIWEPLALGTALLILGELGNKMGVIDAGWMKQQ